MGQPPRKKSRATLVVLLFLLLVLIALVTVLVAGIVLITGSDFLPVMGEKVAVVRIEGVLYDAQEWCDQLDRYGEDQSVRAIVLRIDSPGGLVSPSQELHQKVVDLRTKYRKVVVASFSSMAASGGYYAGCGADMIVSAAGTLTGSIGVYMKFWQAQDLLDRIGVGTETVKAGEYKEWGGIDKPLTPEERRMLESVANDTYAQFVEAVQEGRKARLLQVLRTEPDRVRNAVTLRDGRIRYPFSEEFIQIIEQYHSAIPESATETESSQSSQSTAETGTATAEVSSVTSSLQPATGTITPATGEVESDKEEPHPPAAVEEKLLKALAYNIADGKVYTGRQALEIGLVDKLGTLDDAVKLAAGLAGMKGEPRVVESRELKPSILDLLTRSLSHAAGKVRPPLQYRMPY